MRQTIFKSVAVQFTRIFGLFATIPFYLRKNRVLPPENVAHADWINFLSKTFNKKGLKVLEM